MQMGKRTRMSFARIEEALAVPDLIEVQKNSYRNFLKEGLREVLADVSPITDYSESLILEFTDYSLDDKPKYTVEKCKERDATFAAPLKVTVRLTNRDTHETVSYTHLDVYKRQGQARFVVIPLGAEGGQAAGRPRSRGRPAVVVRGATALAR